MPSLELAILTGLIIGSACLTIWAHYKITQIAASTLAGKVEELNLALGEAIQMVQNGATQAENPLMAIISKVLDQQIDAPVSAKIVEQDESGKFVKKIE